MKASKETGAFSAEMMSKCSEYWTGRTSTSTTCVVGANHTRPVFDGTGSTPPCPKKNGCSTSTPSCPASIAAQPDGPSRNPPSTIPRMPPIGLFISPLLSGISIDRTTSSNGSGQDPDHFVDLPYEALRNKVKPISGRKRREKECVAG